jgi:hypothetical protein
MAKWMVISHGHMNPCDFDSSFFNEFFFEIY